MQTFTISRFASLGLLAVVSSASGCVFVGDWDDARGPAPKAITYEVCYSDYDCLSADDCEELAVPAGRYVEYVNAICTFQCFDDLDCPPSEFNLLPGACVDHAILGGPPTSRICVERCEYDSDCDVASGFGCELVLGERICVPIR